jgi:CRP-like cAMP-binding protein
MKKGTENINKLVKQLNERQKELNCLYKVNEILKNSETPIGDIIMNIVETIPFGYQFPEICKVSIHLNGKEYQSEELEKTELKQSAKIELDQSEVGEIQVYYIKPVKLDTGTVFLFEEQQLINSIAENISQYITMQRFKELLNSNKEISDKLHIPVELGSWLSELHLNENEIEEILSTSVEFKKGDIIFKQGTLVSYLAILTNGMVKVHIEDIQGRGFIYKLAKPFELIGLSALFGKGIYGFTATAILPSKGYLVRRETVKKILEQNPKFNYEILNRFSNNLNLAYSRMNFLANKQALGRLCEILLYLWKDIFDEKIIENFIPRRIIAELSGMSTENAVRILSELKNDGIIETGKEGITVLNTELLETYSHAG